ncbi:hypothetical protein [Myroides marinus]|uniref:Uncharacterized protein n=1 Tax=Myroides marinus TaxID=703342 RepID=A0A1H6X023_9FLAO|nr:hypothetical protein [Myroides marinus]MDM1378018.1 hypothetical protein [Myroides marinus]MDM1385289.1 hypothetical protein [Myroides marinus]MDM1392502.1 hypothetical protein [Myroides marinus]MDM1503755.1 hypothetical protein [Myroides marinus]SEJ22481.1 hypothetical protein SAMN04488018_11764 [Myroides marinus]
MKKNIITLLAVVLSATAFAQVKNGVGFGAKKVDPSAALQVDATDKGVLIPRIEIKDLATYGLAGNSAPVGGMIVFNKTAVGNADATKAISVGFHYWSTVTAKWELITSQSQLNTVVKEVKEEVKKEIEKITNITGGTAGDNSYLVSFKPDKDGESNTTGVLSYLYPVKDDKGNITSYTKKTISFAELVKNEETNTFIREVKELVKFTDNNVEKEELRVVAYVYFSEAAIRKFKADKPNEAIDKITDDYGTKLDISAVVTNNTKNIFNDKETIKEVTKILENAKDVVRAVSDGNGGVKLVYKAVENGPDIDFPINLIETKTKFGRLAADGDMATIAAGDYKPVETAPTTAKKGEVIYQYYGEDATKPNFINVTSDIIKTINENKEVKETFNKTVNEYLTKGGNVYYGVINDPATGKPFDGPVLFEKIDKGDGTFVDTPIDISKDILKVIEKDSKLIEKIKELTNVKISEGIDLPTGVTIGGKEVYKGFANIKVQDNAGYDSGFKIIKKGGTLGNEYVTIAPNKVVVDKDGNATTVPVDANFGRLLKVSVLAKGGSVVIDSATDVITTPMNEKMFSFSFGLGSMYTPIENGDYEIIFEYVVK